jgi:hypothetical protein
MKLKTNKTFTKKQKKNKNQKDQIKKKNSIWKIRIEWWNWKQIKLLQKDQEKK